MASKKKAPKAKKAPKVPAKRSASSASEKIPSYRPPITGEDRSDAGVRTPLQGIPGRGPLQKV